MRARRLRVSHVIHGLGAGGAERVLVELAGVASDVGIDMSVVCLTPDDGQPHLRGLREAGVDVTTLPTPSRWDPRVPQRAADALRRQRPHLLHAHMKHADLVSAYAARRLSVPFVSTLHMVEDTATGLEAVKRWGAVQARERCASRTIAVSDAVRSWYLESFRARPYRVVTVANGIRAPRRSTPAERERLRTQLGVPLDATLVTNVGVMRPGKGHAHLLAAAARIGRDANIWFLLLGDGALRNDLEAVAAASRDSAPVVFAGYRTDVSDILQASDIQVHSSDFDALPTALIEGLAAGIPAIAFDVGGVPEIVSGDTGVLVRAGDVERLAASIRLLASDPRLRRRLSIAARQRFATRFEAGRWAMRLRTVYDEALSA